MATCFKIKIRALVGKSDKWKTDYNDNDNENTMISCMQNENVCNPRFLVQTSFKYFFIIFIFTLSRILPLGTTSEGNAPFVLVKNMTLNAQ